MCLKMLNVSKNISYHIWEGVKNDLINICKNHKYPHPEEVMFVEPYLPYIPKDWNGILVLSESQNIKEGDKYYKWLIDELNEETRMTRLGRKESRPPNIDCLDIGIGPWDDGTIKIALQAIFEGANPKLKLENVAVSNAVPWTKKRRGSKNENPDKCMKNKAKEFWEDIFGMWEPKINMLIVLGNIAEEVMNNIEIKEKYVKNQLKLVSPSQRYLNFVRGAFDCNEVEKSFPMIQKAFYTLEIDKNTKYYKNKVFYAHQAVIRGLDKFKECFCL
jgi:hypothetical protein